MGDELQLPRRRSIRLRGYDYAQPGIYFVTFCAWQMRTIFGVIREGDMKPNALGQVVIAEWLRTPHVRAGVELDVYVLMPNHFHGVVGLMPGRTGVRPYARTTEMPILRSPSQTLGALVRGFKAASTKRINEIRGTPGQPVWHRNYYEHIVRNAEDLREIQDYIRTNPRRWEWDRINPQYNGSKTPDNPDGRMAIRPYSRIELREDGD